MKLFSGLRFWSKWIIFTINQRWQKSRRIKAYITCAGNNDGVGAQVHAVFSTMLFAKLYDLTYIHTPFTSIQHNASGIEDWENKWEHFFSIGTGETAIRSATAVLPTAQPLRHPLLLWKKPGVLYSVRNCHECTDLVPDQYDLIRTELQQKFFAGKEFKTPPGAGHIKHIAVHIRRGDVSSGMNSDRYTNVETIIQVLEQIFIFMSDNRIPYKLHIYSQGKAEEFALFDRYQPVMHLSENEYDSFFGLVSADILVMAKSSFSYAAALLSRGIIIYDDFWHRPLSSWVPLKQKDPAQLHARLKSFITN